jgi:hypothetical protein
MTLTRKPLRALLALAPALWLTACAHADPALPDAARFAPVALPVAAAGEAECDGTPCLSERQADELFNATIDAACAANARLAWLSDYFLGGRAALPGACSGE